MNNKIQTIHEILETNDKILVNKVISQLTDEDKELFNKRFGNDLEKPFLSSDWNYNDSIQFYTRLIPNMKKILSKEVISDDKIANEETSDYELLNEESLNKTTIEEETKIIKKQGKGKKLLTIYQILKTDDKDLVKELINSLTIEEQNLFKRRNGDNLTKLKQSDDWTHDDTIKYNVIIKKMKRRLLRMKTNKPSRLLTMYKLLDTNDKNLILEIVNELSDKEKQLFWSRNGADLDHPVPSDDWNSKYQSRFYANLLPKMRKMIFDRKNNNKIEEKTQLLTSENSKSEIFDKNKSIEILEIPDVQLEKTTIETNEKNTEIDNVVDNTLLPHFDEVLKELSIKDAIIVSLKLGFASKYTTDDISNFLKIDKEEIRNITENALNIYKKYFTNYIDSMIDDKPMEVETKQKDYTIMLQNLNFGSLLNEIPIMDAIIMCLFLGLVNGKKFTINEISVFFKIEKEEIIRINKKSLPLYKKIINDNINKVIEEITEQKTK